MAEAITKFRGEHQFLSNFWPATVCYRGLLFPTVEHGYVAAKVESPEIHRYVSMIENPGEAKSFGSKLLLREDWDEVKIHVMRDLVMQKFANHKDLGASLVATGSRELIEGNTWGDVFWGVCEGKGQNWLGRVLMESRRCLQ